MARPDKWEQLNMDQKLDAVRGWAMHGSTDKEICEMLDISESLFYKWKKDKKEFMEALMKGKKIADGEILCSAKLQSTGFTYKKQVAIKVKDVQIIDGKAFPVERIEIVEVEDFCPPNATMAKFMITNRVPDYKDKQSIEHSGELQIDINTEGGELNLLGLNSGADSNGTKEDKG
jgi:transposase-like protein